MDQIFCIFYPMQFKKDKDKDILSLIDFGNKLNTMTLSYIAKIGLKKQKTNVDVQNFDNFSLKTYGIVVDAFDILNKLSQSRFFEKTFLLADIKMEVIFGILFLTISNVDV